MSQQAERKSHYVLSTTVQKTFSILECIGQYQPVSAAAIQKHVRLNKGNVHRLLATLEHLGYVKKVEKSYVLTFRMYALGDTVPESRKLIQLAKSYMEKLSSSIRHNVSLLVESCGTIIRIFQIEYPGDLQLAREIDMIFPLNCSSTGKLYLAHLPAEELPGMLATLELVRKTEASITDPRVLLKEIEKVRRNGYATEIQEYNEYMTCLAVPIYNHAGQFIAGLSVTSPSFAFPEPQMRSVLPDLIQAARQISAEMGTGSDQFPLPAVTPPEGTLPGA